MGLVADLDGRIPEADREAAAAGGGRALSGRSLRRGAASALALLGLALGARAEGPAAQGPAELPDWIKPSASLRKEDLEGYGINPDFIVAVRLADDQRLLVAEHRPGESSALHVLLANGAYGYRIDVPSPQLADFTVGADSRVLLIGSLGTRFYSADLGGRKAREIMASLPDRPGFRALPPVSILRTEQGPVVYGLFYDDKDKSRETGFARIAEDGKATNALPTQDWSTRFGLALSLMPDPRLRSGLIVTQDPRKAGEKSPPRRLVLTDASGKGQEIDSGDDIFGAVWSPTGASFAYVRRRGSAAELVAASVGAPPFVLASGPYLPPVFLNGGKTLLAASKEAKGVSLWAMRYPSGSPRRIALPEGPCIHVSGPSGRGFAVWGPWGLRSFTVAPA